MHASDLPDFLPGELVLARGRCRDYQQLSDFHYLCGPPATFADVWTIRYQADDQRSQERVVAVAVLSYPVPSCLPRRRVLRIKGSRSDELRFANRRIRTISRVIVHPQFRALGLSTRLIRCLCQHCNTRYIEAMAVMGRAHPLFERAGMKRYNPRRDEPDRPVYFLLDRYAHTNRRDRDN